MTGGEWGEKVEKTIKFEINNLNELLAFTLKERGCGVRDAAKAIGMSSATVSRIVNGGGFEAKWILPIAEWCGLTMIEDAWQLWQLLEAK